MVHFALLVNLSAHALRQNYAQEDASERERKVRMGLFMQITSSRHFSSALEQIHVYRFTCFNLELFLRT